jgi:hypothetical protein
LYGGQTGFDKCHLSSYFFEPTDQKLCTFEVLRRSMGKAGMCWSQPVRVDYINPKRWAVGIRNLEKSPLRVSSPIFWTLPLHLGGWNLPSLIEIGDFTFFQILFLLNLEYTWTSISTVGILVSWKNEISKNSTRIASVMESFCTLLQCKVDLSMFHLPSTSKIWQTST